MRNLVVHIIALFLFGTSMPIYCATNSDNLNDSQLRAGTIEIPNYLSIKATKDGVTTGTVITESATASNKYDNFDIYKLFTFLQNVADVYTLAEGYACAFNKFNAYPFVAPLGIKTTNPGLVRIDFNGVNSFKDADVYLINTANGSEQNLKENPSYELYLDGSEEVSLFVSFRKASTTTNNENATNNEGIKVFASQGEKINVKSSPTDLIEKITVYNLSGNIIHQFYGSSNTYSYETSVPRNQVYLVQVITEKETKTAKVLVK